MGDGQEVGRVDQAALVGRLRKMGEPVHNRIWLHGIGSHSGEVTWSNEADPSGEPEEAEWAVEYVLAASIPTPSSNEAVAWQRNHLTQGWIYCREGDVAHYRSVGEAVRPLYAHPPAASSAGVASDDEVEAVKWIQRAREMMWHQREKADDYLNQAIAALKAKP